ncbi:MAG: serine protease [Chlamydiia bacterium]|nr:serine protease [Chlamydiia bacterium]
MAQTLDQGKEGERIIIHLSSSSGEIDEVISLAQKIYDLKVRRDKYIIVFIQGKAVGPAAIFPFLADELIATPLVAWGDIPYGTKGQMTQKDISSAVKPMINQSRKNAQTLDILADAMVDPHYQLIYENGEGHIEKERERQFDPLVLNIRGMQSLALVNKVLTDEEFVDQYFSKTHLDIYAQKRVPKEDLSETFKKYISYSETEENYIGYLSIGNNRPIDQSTYIYVKFVLKNFVEKGVRFVILDLNTPGGEVLAALKIVDLLQKLDIEHHIPVVAFIHDWAVSAGAMLAYSSRFIGIEQGSVMGAAEPVILGKEGEMASESEKINSTLRAQMGTLASFYDRSPLIAEAMVDKDIILVLRDHQIVKLHDMGEIRSTGPHPDQLITTKGSLLTLNGEKLMEYGVANFMVSSTPGGIITEKELKKGEWPASRYPVFQEPFFSRIPHAIMIDYHDWRVGFFTILTHPAVASLLLIGLVIGLYIEINTPGFGVPGSIALVCLALILLSSFASQAVNWIEIIILCVGLVLFALELFVIPGFGVVGILGIILTIIGLFALMLPGIDRLNFFEIETFRLVGDAFIKRLAWLFGGLAFAILMILLMAHFFSHRYFRFSKLPLKGRRELGMPEIGDLGESVTPLCPSGKVYIGESFFDGCTQGEFLDKHTPVKVISIEGTKVVVKQIKEHKDFS